MNIRTRSARRGFTLIEILIVVIILGILAAIVIPQFSSASSDAKKASLQSTVQTLRSQIALYKLQHGDTLPNLSGTGAGNGWPALTASSVYQGGTNAAAVAGADFVYDYGAGTGSGNIWGTSDTATGTIVP
jgi:general secretion pathway protein G